MIIYKSPLRISLWGGGTDIPTHYSEYGGCFASAAIEKFVYISVTKPFNSFFKLRYSENENSRNINSIKHPYFKQVLKKYKIEEYCEICSFADIPSGTGLGSSGAFLVALIAAINDFSKKKYLSKNVIAETACNIEMKDLNLPVGKQDQFASAYGGINEFLISKNGDVKATNLNKSSIKTTIENNSILIFTGIQRSSSKALIAHKKNQKANIKKDINYLKEMLSLAKEQKKFLKKGDYLEYAKLLNIHWKRKLENNKSKEMIFADSLIQQGKKLGSTGGKLIGAGNGGFVMLIANDTKKIYDYFTKKGFYSFYPKISQSGVTKIS